MSRSTPPGSLNCGKDKPETNKLVTVGRGNIVAASRPDNSGSVVRAAATHDAGDTRQGTRRVFLRTFFIVFCVMPVFAPFPDVAGHVVQPQPVWPPGACLMGLLVAVDSEPGVCAKFIRVAGAGPLLALAAASRRILPLRLGRQPVILAGLAVQLPDKFLGFFP